ncbi:threonylcarbamoyl-AMP synthase [Candidatus Woesearchaeota archaeon]|nr:threonylcarbamoyl-AMP synthase [Candidatus Woesearchaeota archaeon]
MGILSKEEFLNDKELRRKILEENTVFIYPTDTIYGIGCNAENEEAVSRIRKIKERKDNPFSVIAPSKEWILENCEISDEKALDKLPGPYTLIVKKKRKSVAESVTINKKTLGVRIPDNWFSKFVSEIKVPIISTSANKSMKDFMTSLEDLDEDIKNEVDFIIYEGEKKARPSKIIDLTSGNVIER